MYTAGIIAEYNPFHMGHEYHIRETRKLGATHIVAALGSSFTQRGDLALLSKPARVKAAILGGADLVIELPAFWSMSTANNFAIGGVSALSSLGVVNALSFGSESGDVAQISEAVEAAGDPKIKPILDRYLETGATFAAARQAAVAELFGEKIGHVLSEPNNILAAEYISAARRLGANLDFLTVGRAGAAHDSHEEGCFRSAAAIRENFASGGRELPSVTDYSREIILEEDRLGRTASLSRLETAVLCKLKLMKKDEFTLLPDLSEGIENRLYRAAHEAGSLDTLYSLIKTKRYTLARVRRLILSAFLGFDNSQWLKPVPYIRVLGLNERGAEILALAREKAALPIVMKAADAEKLGGRVQKVISLEVRATDMFNMATAAKNCGENEYTNNIYRNFGRKNYGSKG